MLVVFTISVILRVYGDTNHRLNGATGPPGPSPPVSWCTNFFFHNSFISTLSPLVDYQYMYGSATNDMSSRVPASTLPFILLLKVVC